jgi:hypothetical protein
MNMQWHEPDVSVIHLNNGQTVEAEVNGRDFDGTSGFVFVGGREIEVERQGETDEWAEVSRA